MAKGYQNGVLEIDTDGNVSVAMNPAGLPSFESVVPSPMQPLDKRERVVSDARDSIHMQGYFITAEKLIRNMAFDKRGEQSTTQISFRICKNEDEAAYVIGKVKAIVEAKLTVKGG